MEDDYRTAVNIAWHGAAFQRAKKLPDLKKILRRQDARTARRAAINEDALKEFMRAHNERVRRERSKNGEAR